MKQRDPSAPGLAICLFALTFISQLPLLSSPHKLHFPGSLANWLLAHKEDHWQELEEQGKGRSQNIFPLCFKQLLWQQMHLHVPDLMSMPCFCIPSSHQAAPSSLCSFRPRGESSFLLAKLRGSHSLVFSYSFISFHL